MVVVCVREREHGIRKTDRQRHEGKGRTRERFEGRDGGKQDLVNVRKRVLNVSL